MYMRYLLNIEIGHIGAYLQWRDNSTHDACARPAFMRLQGEPFRAAVWISLSGMRLGEISVSDLSYQHIANRQQRQCVTITAGKWKALWGKQTPLIHIAPWSARWTQMSETLIQMAIFIFLIPKPRDFKFPLKEKSHLWANPAWKIMALLNWII